jgi:hypothetical protein
MISLIIEPLSSTYTGFEVVPVDGVFPGRWTTAKASSEKNIQLVKSLCPTKAKPRPFVVIACSFGCRVVCEMLSHGQFEVAPRGIVFCGFPLYPPVASKKVNTSAGHTLSLHLIGIAMHKYVPASVFLDTNITVPHMLIQICNVVPYLFSMTCSYPFGVGIIFLDGTDRPA